MAGKKISATDAKRLGNLLRDYEGGQLGPGFRPETERRFDSPPPIVVACYDLVTIGNSSVSGETTVYVNRTDRPFSARRLQPVDSQVQWIRMMGSSNDENLPGPGEFQLECNDQRVTIGDRDEAPTVRDKLISGLGLPDSIEVRGCGDILDDGSTSNPGWWAVRFPDLPTDSELYRLLWYDDPEAGVQNVARIDSYPWWPMLLDMSIWKAIPSTDLIPNFSFVHCTWLSGRGYVADQWECEL